MENCLHSCQSEGATVFGTFKIGCCFYALTDIMIFGCLGYLVGNYHPSVAGVPIVMYYILHLYTGPFIAPSMEGQQRRLFCEFLVLPLHFQRHI